MITCRTRRETSIRERKHETFDVVILNLVTLIGRQLPIGRPLLTRNIRTVESEAILI